MDPLFGFTGERVNMIGSIELNTKFGHEGFEHKTIKIKYVVGTSYDVLLE